MTAAARSAWHDRRFRTFALGSGINSVGESMYALALPLLAFQLTGSLTAMALLASAYPLVITLSGPLIGVAVDRWGARSFVLAGLGLQISAALALNLALLAGRPALWMLFLAEAFVQLGAVTYRAGWMAGLPLMFPENTSRARGAMLTTYQATVVIGPALAAALILPLGASGLLWLNLITFLAPIAVWCSGISPERRRVERTVRWCPTQDLAEGWIAFRASGQVPLVMLVLVPLNLVFSTGTISLLLFYLRDALHLSASTASLVIVACNVAALGGAVHTSERSRWSIPVVASVGLTGIGLCLAAVPATETVAIVIASAMGLYALNSMVEVAAEMVLYERIPVEGLGRALGLFRLVLGVPALISPLVIAAAADAVGTAGAFLALGVLALVPGLWLLVNRGRALSGGTSPRLLGRTAAEGPAT